MSPECKDDKERYDHGVLSRECAAAIAVAALQSRIRWQIEDIDQDE